MTSAAYFWHTQRIHGPWRPPLHIAWPALAAMTELQDAACRVLADLDQIARGEPTPEAGEHVTRLGALVQKIATQQPIDEPENPN